MTWFYAILVIALVYLVYTLVPEVIYHTFHLGSFYHGKATDRTLVLTFDDGPDERYTPQILDVLKEKGVQATFFVVGERADAHPELISRMVAEGHEVAIHSYQHRHAFFQDPWHMHQQIARAKAAVSRLTGLEVRYYRPPWGAFNWATWFSCRLLGLTPVLWSVRAKDWIGGNHAEEIVQRVIRQAQPGSIVLCHDGGGAPGAPVNTIAALPHILQRLEDLNFNFTTVAKLHEEWLLYQNSTSREIYRQYPVFRRILIALWQLVEKWFSYTYHVLTLNAIFRISPREWTHGERRSSETGDVLVHDGAKAIDLHFQNATLLAVSGAHDNRALIRALRMTRHSFQDIARVMNHHPDYQDAEVVAAFTLMNRGIELLGFHVEELPDTLGKRWLQMYMRFLMGMYHPDGFRRLHEGRQELTLKLVWMTRKEVLDLYGTQEDLRRSEPPLQSRTSEKVE